MTGVQFFRLLNEQYPALAPRLFFLSGGCVSQETHKFLRDFNERCIAKPFDVGVLRKIVRANIARVRAGLIVDANIAD
jgi:hypothetical protein